MECYSIGRIVKIGGAGIAGLTAAMQLKKNGYQPIVFEKKTVCGEGRFGDYEGLETWNFSHNPLEEIRSIKLPDSFVHTPIYKFNIHIPDYPIIPINSTEPFFYITSRGSNSGDLDYVFQENALQSGVSINFNSTTDLNEMDIIATGSGKASAFIQGITFQTDTKDQIHLFLGNQIAPYGYGYIIILQGKGTLAVAFKKGRNNTKALVEKLVGYSGEMLNIQFLKVKKFGSYGSFGVSQNKCDKKNRIYIGEAGGFQDYLFGFGIQYAIKSGYLAAKSISESISFNKLWKRELRSYMAASYFNRLIFEKLNDPTMYKICNSLAAMQNPVEKIRKFCKPGVKAKLLSFTV